MNLDHPMTVPLLLMVLAAPLGAFDVKYYHLWKFKLYRQPSARWETVTHLLRGFLFVIGAFGLLNFEFHGSWFWALGGLFAFDFINEVADVISEPESRKPLGGLPKMEYLIHIIGSTMGGAITASYFILAWKWRDLPNAIVYLPSDTFPVLLTVLMWGLIASGLTLTVFEGYLFFRHWRAVQVRGTKQE